VVSCVPSHRMKKVWTFPVGIQDSSSGRIHVHSITI
jgi:hypothetical protein